MERAGQEAVPGPDDVRAALDQLDGTEASAVALLAGIPVDELDRYGGMPRQ